ncbi:MAG: ArsR family transcriptional regulator [Desulfuromonadaceae bacterium]|nr:ArsR family transcriptional regulator [Desulfuromonadaceae bacterium]
MLESLFGSINKERVLFFIYARSQGHARDMARFFACSLTPLQRQLEILERGGILVSSLVGRTRLYSFNPRYPLLAEVTDLVEKALTFYPEDERLRLQMERQRPRRAAKPL